MEMLFAEFTSNTKINRRVTPNGQTTADEESCCSGSNWAKMESGEIPNCSRGCDGKKLNKFTLVSRSFIAEVHIPLLASSSIQVVLVMMASVREFKKSLVKNRSGHFFGQKVQHT